MSKIIKYGLGIEKKLIVGTLLADDRGGIYRIEKIEKDSYVLHSYSRENKNFENYYGTLSRKRAYEYIVIDSVDDLEKSYNEVISNMSKYEQEETEEESSDTSLALTQPLSLVKELRSIVEQKKLVIDKARAHLEHQKNLLWSMSNSLETQIGKLQKVIDAIEMYLGSNQDIVVLKEGQPVDGPIHIRQGILYMDEEYGDPRPNPKTGQNGIDFQSVEDFDAWLVDNIDKILAEKKGIVAMKPSRLKRTYTGNPFLDASLNEENSMTYLIIRNGENLYRVWTDKRFGSRLYPTKEEMEKIISLLENSKTSWETEKALDREYIYKRNILIIQGIIDRSDVFKPMFQGANLFKPETYDKSFVFIRDDENIISDGRPSWKDWIKEINSKIDVGSRILFVHPRDVSEGDGYISPKDYSDRYLIYSPRGDYPPFPRNGVYTIQKRKSIKRYFRDEPYELFYIMYNPGDEVYFSGTWEYDPHIRKNRVSFGISQSDKFVINYDQIELDDIEYYINSRKDRKDFIHFMMLLWKLRDSLIEEKQKESDFVKLVAGRMSVDEHVVWDAVSWWKFKNKWKRSVDSDDAKALRMIEKRIRSHGTQLP